MPLLPLRATVLSGPSWSDHSWIGLLAASLFGALHDTFWYHKASPLGGGIQVSSSAGVAGVCVLGNLDQQLKRGLLMPEVLSLALGGNTTSPD